MTAEERKVCGIVMPISAIDDCSESHLIDVLSILTEAVEESGYTAKIVSHSDDAGVIQKRIVQNLYDNPIVICDVSGKNPNVMFELGMRLAFDKPTIIVKDDKTSYSFDTAGIEHLEYPRDLRFSRITDFKSRLAEKIQATVKSSSDPNYTTFLKHFGEFKVAKIDQKEVSSQEFILEEIKILSRRFDRLERVLEPQSNFKLSELIGAGGSEKEGRRIRLYLRDFADLSNADIIESVSSITCLENVRLSRNGSNIPSLFATITDQILSSTDIHKMLTSELETKRLL